MELYFSPFACSLASHIVAREAGAPLTLQRVTLSSKQLADGSDYGAVSPKGYVPTLRRDDGTLLTETPAVLQYLAEHHPQSGLLPPAGSPARYAVLEWVSYVSTELHKGILYLIFNPVAAEPVKAFARSLAARKLEYVATHLTDRRFLVGDQFTIADAGMTWALTIMPHAGVPLEPWPALRAYLRAMHQRPAVAAAIAAEQQAQAAA